ncbi:MAG: N-6 DNA methylase [Actinomycetota bacterium]
MADDDRKRLGAWYTPPALVDLLVEAAVDGDWATARGPVVRVLDPACGDGRFLAAAIDALGSCGVPVVEAIGIDVDPGAVAVAAAACPEATILERDALGDGLADALSEVFGAAPSDPVAGGHVDLVIGNPPFLSQLASATTRGGASRHGGGPYADAAAEFLALGSRLADPAGGRLAFVLPQSLLSARDADEVRRSIDERATMLWSSWTGERDFDAQVVTCALVFEFDGAAGRPHGGMPAGDVSTASGSWASVVTDRLGVPPVPDALAQSRSTLADRAWLNANFRDEYYGMIPAVGDHDHGPPLITSGVIDPATCRWGERRVRFAKQDFAAPRIDLDALDDRMRAWARRRLRPKVLVANQTRILEAVADPDGDWLPGVPVVAVYPEDDAEVWDIAAILTSASASAWAWHERGGSGLSATNIRIGPVMLGQLPWPTGSVAPAVSALRAGDVLTCGRLVDEAYGVTAEEGDRLANWWAPLAGRGSPH